MINFQDEIARLQPSLDVDDIERAIADSDLTDMNDLMMNMFKNGIDEMNTVRKAAADRSIYTNEQMGFTRFGS